MKCQILFSGKNKKNVIILFSAELIVVKVNQKKLSELVFIGEVHQNDIFKCFSYFFHKMLSL